MAKFKRSHIRRFGWLLPIPLVWCALSYFGLLQPAENAAQRWRYRLRGEITAPVEIAYVNVDARAQQAIGERPWSRGDFAAAARALMTVGGARAIGFDFVFSNLAVSRLVPAERIRAGNLALAGVTREFPNVILAGNYPGGQSRLFAEEKPRQFPYLRHGAHDRNENDLPELPEDPIMGMYVHPQTKQIVVYGIVGMIDVDYTYDGAERPPPGWPYFYRGDEVPRWVPLFAQTPGPTYYHLSVELARIALGVERSGMHLENDVLKLVRADQKEGAKIPLRAGQMLEVNWFSRWDNPVLNPSESMADVLLFAADLRSSDPKTKAEAETWFERFRGAIILIGPTDPLLQDIAPTPFDESGVPKVGLHGNLVKTIVSGLYIERLSHPLTMALIFCLTFVVSLLVIASGARSKVAKILAVTALGGYVVFAFQIFAHFHWVIPLVGPLGSAFTTSFVALIWQVMEEEKQKGRIKGMFGTYVSPQLVERMIESGEDPHLGGHAAEITAYFSDIQAFSAFSEKLPPARLVELMNEYLTACTDIVYSEGGTLDKYIGDAMVVMFGAPLPLKDHALRACVASQRVHRRLAELRLKWAEEGEKWPEIVSRMQSRIGLNSGLAIIGNMGSTSRFDYTMMGDNVNLAARMESGAKAWGAYTMCTESTKLACEAHGGNRVVFRPLGRIVVKGRTTAVPIYEIVGLREDILPETLQCVDLFATGLTKYFARDWDGALACFAQSTPLEPNLPGKTLGVVSNPSIVYTEITESYKIDPPPADWDGTYVMKEK